MIPEEAVKQAIAGLFIPTGWTLTKIQWVGIPFNTKGKDSWIRPQITGRIPKPARQGSEWDNAALEIGVFITKKTGRNLYDPQKIIDALRVLLEYKTVFTATTNHAIRLLQGTSRFITDKEETVVQWLFEVPLQIVENTTP